MSLQPVMSSQDMMEVSRWAELQNRRLADEFDRSTDPNQQLGRDDFLRILLTQLSHQDPTAPMQDTEFIAQMAQFSALEQMTNMAADFNRMATMLRGNEAQTALGRTVEIAATGGIADGETIRGVVEAVTREEMPQVLVNGRFFGWDQVVSIRNNDE